MRATSPLTVKRSTSTPLRLPSVQLLRSASPPPPSTRLPLLARIQNKDLALQLRATLQPPSTRLRLVPAVRAASAAPPASTRMTLRSTTARRAQEEVRQPSPPRPPSPTVAPSTSPALPPTRLDSDSESSDDDDIYLSPPDASATPLDPTTAAVAALLAKSNVTKAELEKVILHARPVRSLLTTRTALAARDITEVRTELAKTILSGLATSTQRDRQALWARYENFLADHKLEVSDSTAALFVMATGVTPQTRLTYAKSLSAIFGRLQLCQDMLSKLMSGLRAQGAAMPQRQATPISRDHLLEVAASFPPADQAAILLAWKTASRWGDITAITTNNIISRTADEVIIFWGKDTKTMHQHQYVPSSFAVVTGALTEDISRHLPTTRNTPLTTITGDALRQRMARLFPTEHYTCHSIKRGALAVLTEKGVPLDQVARLAKHKTPLDEVSATTIRYVSTGSTALATARALGTQNATVHL